ncbi:Alpha/Beta hydrolase protein [Filobasidium floriforme]|nr:Alpha/Beta hydrolase protein [Filobasidium floriforme]KAH8085142.1 Alpha/Beta hydrolase protein [Filobasidium floriforme]
MTNRTSRYIDVDTYRIYSVETIPNTTSTLPTVVLIAGIGATTVTWSAVQRLISPNLRTFSYDRLGLGKSDGTDLARPAALLAKELKDTLVAGNIPSPYLLVAHSYGGIIAREFLQAYDHDVAGLVYIDANQENTHVRRDWPIDATMRCIKTMFTTDDATGLAEDHRLTVDEWGMVKEDERVARERRASANPPRSSEGLAYVSSLEALGLHRQLYRQALGNRPIHIIVANLARDFKRLADAGKAEGLGSEEDHERLRKYCERLPAIELELAREVTRLSSTYTLVVADHSGHLVPYWDPDLCVREIERCIENWQSLDMSERDSSMT